MEFYYIDPPHVSDDLRVLPELESQGMGGVPELLMTAEDKVDYRIKAGTSVIMGKIFNINFG